MDSSALDQELNRLEAKVTHQTVLIKILGKFLLAVLITAAFIAASQISGNKKGPKTGTFRPTVEIHNA